MSKDLNKFIATGRVGKKNELKSLGKNGDFKVTDFSLAISYSKKGEDGKYENATNWLYINLMGKTAEFFDKYANVGDRVAVEGHVVNEEFTDKEGNKRSMIKVKAWDVVIMSSKSDGKAKTQSDSGFITDDEETDDLPF